VRTYNVPVASLETKLTLPGFEWDPMSLLPLNVPVDETLLETFDPAEHSHTPDDEPIRILPFTHSPVGLLDLPKVIPESKVTLADPPDGGPSIKFLPAKTDVKSVPSGTLLVTNRTADLWPPIRSLSPATSSPMTSCTRGRRPI
jgi:hypothetical protein